MKNLLCLLALFLIGAPALAGEHYIVFRNGAVRTSEVVYSDNPPAGTVSFPFVLSQGDRCPEHYTHNGSQLIYDYVPPAPPVQPKPVQFIKDCTADAAIPANMRQNLNLMGLWFRSGDKDVALLIWNLIKASATAQQISAIQAHAANNNITLP